MTIGIIQYLDFIHHCVCKMETEWTFLGEDLFPSERKRVMGSHSLGDITFYLRGGHQFYPWYVAFGILLKTGRWTNPHGEWYQVWRTFLTILCYAVAIAGNVSSVYIFCAWGVWFMYTTFMNFTEFAATGVVDFVFSLISSAYFSVGVEHYLRTGTRIMKHTIGRTLLDEVSARRRGLCLTTHNKRQTFLPSGGIRTRNLNMRTAAVEMLSFKEWLNSAWCKKPDYSVYHKTATLHPKPETSHFCVSRTPQALWQDCL